MGDSHGSSGAVPALVSRDDTYALQEACIVGNNLGRDIGDVGFGTLLRALRQSLADKQYAAAGRAPVMHDHGLIAGEADLEDAVGAFPAVTR